MALGIFYLESGFRHEDKILDYLIAVVRGLGTAVFPDELPSDRSSKLPPAEIFSFLLTTLLNDVAGQHSNSQVVARILDVQLELMTNILAQLQEMKKQDKPSPFNTRKATCKCMVPVLLGLCRSMARFSPPSEESLISKIFPLNKPSCKNNTTSEDTNPDFRMKGYTNFRLVFILLHSNLFPLTFKFNFFVKSILFN